MIPIDILMTGNPQLSIPTDNPVIIFVAPPVLEA